MNHDDIRECFISFDDPPPALAPDDVHCWVFSLEMAAGEDLLDAAERGRASRFHFDCDRRRFIAGHDRIRRILGQYRNAPPHELVFTIAKKGRPALKGGGVNFNYSRSETWGLLAVSHAESLGADIEAVCMGEGLADVARRQFSPEENSALNDLSGAAWTDGFFNCWTRKEAIVKAMGVGLTDTLDDFDVSLQPGVPPEILRADNDSAVARDWALRAFNPVDGYRAAIATDIAAPNLHVLREKPQSGSRQ